MLLQIPLLNCRYANLGFDESAFFQIQQSDFIKTFQQVDSYNDSPTVHSDGPLPRDIRHQGPGHDDDVMPADCQECGIQLASLFKELDVGGKG